jgi:NAD(P)-dependent dehydrogenase (short-subunit alcohol dehydrogenase family)
MWVTQSNLYESGIAAEYERRKIMKDLKTLAVERIGLERDALTNQVAVVAGSDYGIGPEIVRAFAWLGVKVVIADISDAGAEMERTVKESGGRALFVRTDVSKEADVNALAQKTHEMFGPADILVNNAALAPVASVLEMDEALWDSVMAFNLRGTFLTCKAFLPEMLARKHGTIVSIIATNAIPHHSVYIASKQGMAGFSQSLAAEVGEEGVRVIAFEPGFVDTPTLRSVVKELAPRLGMSPRQFMSMSVHPAYAGMMPGDHAGAAVAYLVAALAEECHGEIVDSYTVLERAGFLKVSKVEVPVMEEEPVPVPPSDRAGALQEALTIAEKLGEFLAQIDQEYKKLPPSMQPIAARGFKGKAGQSVQDWMDTAANLTEQLKKIEESDAAAETAFRDSYPRLKELLDKLISYCQAIPGESARVVQDPETLSSISKAMAGRVTQIRYLIAILDTIHA